MLAAGFSLFGGGGGGGGSYKAVDTSREGEVLPRLKVETDKDVYRPGDSLYITIEICNPLCDDASLSSLLIEGLAFEIKGIEKLDSQWFATQKPLPGSKQRRGFIFNFLSKFYWIWLYYNWLSFILCWGFQVNMFSWTVQLLNWFQIRLCPLVPQNHVSFFLFVPAFCLILALYVFVDMNTLKSLTTFQTGCVIWLYYFCYDEFLIMIRWMERESVSLLLNETLF